MKLVPEAALEQHTAILGKNGSGKTYAAKAAIVEPLLDRKRLVGIVDPTGVWWGLRSHADGKRPGFRVLVLGGDHGDLPLVPNGGAAVARLLVEQHVSLVADTSALTVGERTRWMIDFAGTVYRLSRSPLYLVLDEAHVFAPQGKVPDPDAGKMLHAVNALASMGRARGIRLTMITQRPQKLHKDTLTTADTLIAMRVTHPLDRGAVREWIDGCGDPAEGNRVLNSLAGLQRGEGWVWYPEGGHLRQTKFPPIGTFDSSATPGHDQVIAPPKTVAELDLTEIRKAMADAVAEAEANDPKLLRAELARLRAELDKARKEPVSTVENREKLAEELRQQMATGRALGLSEGWNNAVAELEPRLHTAAMALADATKLLKSKPTTVIAPEPIKDAHQRPGGHDYIAGPVKALQRPSRSQLVGDGEVGSGGLRRMLIALAQRPLGLTKRQLGVRAGLSSQSGTFSTYLSKARAAGWIDDLPGVLKITAGGIAALGPFSPLPTGRALLEYWLADLGNSGASRLLRTIAESYPNAVTWAAAAEGADLSPESGTFSTYLSKLRSLELVVGSRNHLQLSEELAQ